MPQEDEDGGPVGPKVADAVRMAVRVEHDRVGQEFGHEGHQWRNLHDFRRLAAYSKRRASGKRSGSPRPAPISGLTANPRANTFSRQTIDARPIGVALLARPKTIQDTLGFLLVQVAKAHRAQAKIRS